MDRAIQMTILHAAARGILHQFLGLIESLPSDATFTRESKVVPGSTIGKHVRHALDHIRILFEGLALIHRDTDSDDTDARVVNYDIRERNVPIESDRAVACIAITNLLRIIDVASRSITNPDKPVSLMCTVDPSRDDVPMTSTYARELWFVQHHAIHHAALIRAICVEYGCDVPEDFGVAPSTLKASDSPVEDDDATIEQRQSATQESTSQESHGQSQQASNKSSDNEQVNMMSGSSEINSSDGEDVKAKL
ncbi:hypothetical protein SmJEL517_g05448 [Synchytrium microbalum]|uniref:DinB-like domain-containing protein n=1 Tax=Synchytrium microbalum TaxID=1806994 RepID=A0A507BW61_9FUNG|nr:uncharacterized protein SmJEL517_g05448 [Synchytrium microbalum]TPX31139.1 hypothetical protein SmJEL517_g05448 [Synchytrium microbalum]